MTLTQRFEEAMVLGNCLPNTRATYHGWAQLGLFEARPGDANVIWLETLLKQHARWIKAAELLQWLGREESEDGKRLVRGLASASEWIVSGQRGYKHLEHCTPEEIEHAANALESQAKLMSDRACAWRRNAHKVFG